MGIVSRLARRLRKKVVRASGKRTRAATYSERVMNRLDAGKVHSSLGPNLKAGSADRATRTFARLVAGGMQPDHVVVDFGCGTLRLGAILVEHLAPDGYIGMDIDQRLLDLGTEMLPVELISAKRPTLRVISQASLVEVAARKPDLVYCHGVLQHIAPEELVTFFGNIATIANDTTKIEIRASKLKATAEKISTNSWSHALRDLETAAGEAGLSLTRFRSKNGQEGSLYLQKRGSGPAPEGPIDTQTSVGGRA